MHTLLQKMDIQSHVRTMIGLKACPVHHEYAVVDIVDNKLDVLCCCSDFKVECMKTLIRIQFFESDFKLKVVWRKN